MSDLTVTGMVLSSMPIGEYDKRLVLLTKELGKITAFARGARRTNSPYLAGSRVCAFGEFSLYRGRDSYSINGISISNYFEELSKDFDKMCLAMYFLEIADYFGKENIEGAKQLLLIYQSFRALLNENIPDELVRCIYELRTLVINGEYMDFFTCKECMTKENIAYISQENEGVFCKACGNSRKFSEIMDNSTIYALQFIVSSEIKKLFTFTVSDSVLRQLSKFTNSYLLKHSDTKFKSLEML